MKIYYVKKGDKLSKPLEYGYMHEIAEEDGIMIDHYTVGTFIPLSEIEKAFNVKITPRRSRSASKTKKVSVSTKKRKTKT